MKKIKKKINSLSVTIIGVVLILAALIVLLTVFVKQLYNHSVDELETSINSLSEIVSVAVDNKFDDYFNNLYIAANGCSRMENINEITEYLKDTNEKMGFRRISYITSDGVAHPSKGEDFEVNITGELKAAFENGTELGEYEEKSYYIENGENQPGLILYVPIYNGENVTAMLMANSSIEGIENEINLNFFDGKGYIHILTNEGNSVVLSKSAEYFFNFFNKIESSGKFSNITVNDLKQEFKAGNSGLVYFTNDDVDKMAAYRPLKRNGWYILTVVPTEYATKEITNTVMKSIIISLLIIVMFTVILFYVLFSNVKKKREIEKSAYVDPITKGSTKAKFQVDVAELIANNPSKTYSLISIDIYKFSIINDSFGSKQGDEVLAYVYNCIKKHLEKNEEISRVSGDVFNILKKTTDVYKIKKFLDDVSEEINRFNENLINKYYLQYYAGVYYIEDTTLDFVNMEYCSNEARKQAREKRTTDLYSYVIYEENQRVRQFRERYIDNHMEQALANGEFVMYLQPKIDLSSNKVGGAEALVRWNDPQFGLVPPGEFIPIFEENGFVRKVDLYIFEQAVKLVRSWLDRGIEPITISVNLSRVQFNNINFLEKYVQTLEKYDVPAKYFEIEVTESIVFNNVDLLIDIINKIHKAGFSCSIDDFGSGYSSLNMLKDMRVDVIKLDRAFLKFSQNNEDRGHQIIANVIQLVKSLGARNVTEGVEKENEVEFLKSVGCDMIQGFFFSKPLPVDEFEVYFEEHR